jgi:hypothetical protein
LLSFHGFEAYSFFLIYLWFVTGRFLVILLNDNITTPSGTPYPSVVIWLNSIPMLIASVSFALYSYASRKASEHYYDSHNLNR